MRLFQAVADFRDRGYASVPEVFCARPDRFMADPTTPATNTIAPRITTATVTENASLCQEHYRLSFTVQALRDALPGQFMHLSPDRDHAETQAATIAPATEPLLRRAFSIAGLTRHADCVEIDVIYRVVGTATRWMASLRKGDRISVLGPQGNEFPISSSKRQAWLIAGGVGLPPMLWLAQALNAAGKQTVAFFGAQRGDLIPLTLDPASPPSVDAHTATLSAAEFNESDTGVVISTDDGSVGFKGHVGAALANYHEANPIDTGDVVAYTCGPERMMRYVAELCIARGIECHVCLERTMACGTGMCQSCVVAINDKSDPDGWRYRLCCTEGPVFNAASVIWETPA